MPDDNNLPAPEAGPVDDDKSYDDLVGDISNLIDPEADLEAGEEVNEADTEEVTDEVAEPDAEDVEQDDASDEDGPEEPEIKGGRFAPDTAKVTLEDGTVITVAELKRNNLFQRDYTRKTQELAAEREQISHRKSEVDQQAQSLSQDFQFMNWFAEHYLPKQPAPPSDPNDPIAEIQYGRELRQWQELQGLRDYFSSKLGELEQTKQAETQAQKAARLRSEAQALVSKDKTFADEQKRIAFLNEAATKGAEYWGLTREEIAGIESHKQWLVLRDALRYRALQAKAPGVAQQVKAKPVVGGKRTNPNAKQNSGKLARTERLRRERTFEAGVDALQDFDL